VPTYLLDASALCKRYFVNETGATLVNDFFQDATSMRYALNLAIPEILNAFYRVCREGHLTEAERAAFIAAFYDDISNDRLFALCEMSPGFRFPASGRRHGRARKQCPSQALPLSPTQNDIP
jgi:hypothetical protein